MYKCIDWRHTRVKSVTSCVTKERCSLVEIDEDEAWYTTVSWLKQWSRASSSWQLSFSSTNSPSVVILVALTVTPLRFCHRSCAESRHEYYSPWNRLRFECHQQILWKGDSLLDFNHEMIRESSDTNKSMELCKYIRLYIFYLYLFLFFFFIIILEEFDTTVFEDCPYWLF